ncbi:uncharacterized protein LOC142352257 isoform X3 [Convolutriloba macropyga]|uniref:uncharacterized protein LOC142352257 isoform X3 n=1 Tax=Convolutriloba macropyga TaxID=536237 RepID=UPI003F51E869
MTKGGNMAEKSEAEELFRHISLEASRKMASAGEIVTSPETVVAKSLEQETEDENESSSNQHEESNSDNESRLRVTNGHDNGSDHDSDSSSSSNSSSDNSDHSSDDEDENEETGGKYGEYDGNDSDSGSVSFEDAEYNHEMMTPGYLCKGYFLSFSVRQESCNFLMIMTDFQLNCSNFLLLSNELTFDILNFP